MKIDLREIPVIWINLDKATSNKEKMIQQFTDYGFKNHQRFSAVTPQILNDRYGFKNQNYVHACGMSHYLILKEIAPAGPVLILEDDAKITNNFKPIIDIGEDIDAVYVGTSVGNVHYRSCKYNDEFLRVSGMLSTHAILYLTEKYKTAVADTILNFVFRFQFPFDVGISDIQKSHKVLAPYNPYFVQADERDSEHKWEYITAQPVEDRKSIFDDNF